MTEHMSEHTRLLQTRSAYEEFGRLPTFCPKGPVGRGHFVRSDNPLRTGRCDNCRAFVVHTRKGWRTATLAQALAWGVVGARR